VRLRRELPGLSRRIEPRTLLILAREHVEQSPCTVEDGTVETVTEANGSFRLELDGEEVHADHVLVASWSDSDFLSTLDIETEQEPDGPVQEIVTDGEGRTSADGIWAAGRITGTHHQALVSAGDGARVALNLVGELVPDVLRRLGRTRGVLQQHGRSIPVGVEEISHDERIRRAEHGREWLIEFFELQQSP
jgi:thioredoxin reductase